MTGKLSLIKPAGVRIVNPPDFSKLTNIFEQARFRYVWNALVAIDKERIEEPAVLTVKFKNRDNVVKKLSVTLN